MKTALLTLGLLACASASALDIDKDIFRTIADEPQPQAEASGNGDLTPDTSYGPSANGSNTFVFDDADGLLDVALRVFPAMDGGYWLAGYHTGASAAQFLAIAKLTAGGTVDTGYGTGGLKTIATTMLNVVDVAKGAGDTLYFVGTRHTGSFTDLDIQIDCVDGNGAPCDGFGSGGSSFYALDLGADAQNKDDNPRRIVWFASQLYVVGEVDTGAGANKNKAAFAINVNPSTGNRNTSFGNDVDHAGVFVYNPDWRTNGRDVAYDVLAYAPSPFQYRLVLVGESGASGSIPGDTDGFVFSVNGITGQADGFIDAGVWADLGTSGADKLTRVMQRHNGGFVVAGTAKDDSANPVTQELLMAAYKADGTPDGDFGWQHSLVLSYRNEPYALAERADTRDIVVGLNVDNDLDGGDRALQGIVQIGRNGNGAKLNATAVLDFPAFTPAARGSWGSDFLLDGSNRIVTAGYRCWKTTTIGGITLCSDEDMTSGRFVATDTIFADAFGGSSSD